MSERIIIAACKKKELSRVTITNHNTIKGTAAFKKIASNNFLVIVGEEIQTKEVEIMSYFMK
jgi:predicted metal-dependent phosphoesterase TrpH